MTYIEGKLGDLNGSPFSPNIGERLRRNDERKRLIPAGSPGSVEELKKVGEFWRVARRESGLTRSMVGPLLNVDPDALLFLEWGLIEPADIHGDFPERYAEVLGAPKLSSAFRKAFLHQDQFTSKQNS